MRNVCPHCGKIIESGQQAFDLTGFFGKQVKKYLESRALPKEDSDNRRLYNQGMEQFFNSMAAEDPLIFTENDLWGMPFVESETRAVVRTILFRFPYEKVKDHMSKIITGRESEEILKQTYTWYMKRSGFMKRMVFRLNLMKMSDGDIRFDMIADDFDSSPITRVRVCPHEGCNGKLSFWAGRYEEICLSVLGGPRVSKTTTLTAMAYRFLQGYQNIFWEGSQSDEAYLEFEKTCLAFYSQGKPIPATEMVKNNIPRISFRVRLANTGYIVLTFVDLPGELNNEEGISEELFRRYQHYFDNVDFIWYCTDPGELVGLIAGAQNGNDADQLGYDSGRAALRTEQICNNMNQMQGFFRQTDKAIPVAYILGKTDSDLISRAEKENYHLFEPNGSTNRAYPVDIIPLDLETFYKESDLVRRFMRQKNMQLVQTFENDFPAKCYFAMSAYGWNPKMNTEQRIPDYYKTTVPFIWMLACKGKIPIRVVRARRNGRTEQRNVYLNNCASKEKATILYNLYMQGNFKIIE